jgi:hypothetical protein
MMPTQLAKNKQVTRKCLGDEPTNLKKKSKAMKIALCADQLFPPPGVTRSRVYSEEEVPSPKLS